MSGNVSLFGDSPLKSGTIKWLVVAMIFAPVAGAAYGGDLYKYRDESGTLVYSDKPPIGEQVFERQTRETRSNAPPRVTIRVEQDGEGVNIWADNACHCPAEVALQLTGGSYSDADPAGSVRDIIPALGTTRLISLQTNGSGEPPDFRFGFIFGDPQAEHAPTEGYRPPFAAGREFMVSQAFPDAMTHMTPDSRYAIDFAMAEHTDIYAAREGLVVEVAHSNFRGGSDWGKFGAEANVVKIMHDDGSFALYAHLSWDSIRVRAGDRVSRGEIIAASGNTGFSTGPHLHFVVVRNEGLRTVSVPIVFSDGRGGFVTATRGQPLKNP